MSRFNNVKKLLKRWVSSKSCGGDGSVQNLIAGHVIKLLKCDKVAEVVHVMYLNGCQSTSFEKGVGPAVNPLKVDYLAQTKRTLCMAKLIEDDMDEADGIHNNLAKQIYDFKNGESGLMIINDETGGLLYVDETELGLGETKQDWGNERRNRMDKVSELVRLVRFFQR